MVQFLGADHSKDLWTRSQINVLAQGARQHSCAAGNFMALDCMDLHILKPNCDIGLHGHRDNQEVFLLLEGQAFMAVSYWAQMPQRERCFEVRTLRAGHMAMLKGGNLHDLMNPSDEDMSLFMFGGCD